MGPESNKREICFYMTVDGQTVPVEPEFAEITYAEDQQSSQIMDNCEFSIRMKLPHSLRCRSRKRFVKLLMARGISRNTAQVLAWGYVVWSNRIPFPAWACAKESYQNYFTDLWARGIISLEGTRRADE